MRRLTNCLRLITLLMIVSFVPTRTTQAQACGQGQSALDLMSAGAIALNARDYQTAVFQYDCALEIDPNLSEAYLGRGMAYILLRDFREGGRDLTSAVTLSGQVDEDYVGAQIAQIEALLAVSPQDVSLMTILGYWHWWSADDDAALATYDQILALEPDNVFAHLYRGSSLMYMGQTRAAGRSFDQAIRLDGQNDTVYSVMAQTQRNTRNYDDMLISMTRALALQPADPVYYATRADAYRFLGNFSAALTDYERALDIAPRLFGALSGAAYASDGQNDLTGAQDYIARALDVQPDDTAMLLLRGQIAFDLRELSTAEADFLRVLELNPDSENAYIGLADVRMARGEFFEAGLAYRQAVEINPQNTTAMRLLITALEEAGDAQGAGQVFNELLTLTREEFIDAGFMPVGVQKPFEIGPDQAYVLTLDVPTNMEFTFRATSTDPEVDPLLVLRMEPTFSGFLSNDDVSSADRSAEIRTTLAGPVQIQIVVAVNNPEGGIVTLSVQSP